MNHWCKVLQTCKIIIKVYSRIIRLLGSWSCRNLSDCVKLMIFPKILYSHSDKLETIVLGNFLDSVLPCVCSEIDHRFVNKVWKNVIREKKTRSSRVCPSRLYYTLTSFGIYFWTDAQQHVFVLYDKKAKCCWWRLHLYICPTIDHKLEPIKMYG